MLWMSEAWRTLELNASALVLSDWKSQNTADAVQTVSFAFRRIVPRMKTQYRSSLTASGWNASTSHEPRRAISSARHPMGRSVSLASTAAPCRPPREGRTHEPETSHPTARPHGHSTGGAHGPRLGNIPAGAGITSCSGRERVSCWEHPRACGDHWGALCLVSRL